MPIDHPEALVILKRFYEFHHILMRRASNIWTLHFFWYAHLGRNWGLVCGVEISGDEALCGGAQVEATDVNRLPQMLDPKWRNNGLQIRAEGEGALELLRK